MVTQEIKLRIHEESDMFTPYDPDQKLLSEDVSDYLIRCYENMHRKSREEFSVHVFSDEPVSEERVKQALRDHCEQQRSNIKHELISTQIKLDNQDKSLNTLKSDLSEKEKKIIRLETELKERERKENKEK